MKSSYYDSPIGILKITCIENMISSLEIVQNKETSDSSRLLREATKQLKEYFSGQRKNFNLPLLTKGTIFQSHCWDQLLKVPYASTITYKELAKRINNPKACRAVGNANNKNRIPIIIPCHRVVSLNSKNGGYALGLHIKEQLINLEKNNGF